MRIEDLKEGESVSDSPAILDLRPTALNQANLRLPQRILNSQFSILNSAQRAEDVPKESPRAVLFQFVLFPLGVVAIAVGIFFLFGKLASDRQTVPDYLHEVRSGGKQERWQAAYQLSQLINVGEAKKYPNLVVDVVRIFDESKSDDPRIRQYLAMVLGNLGDRRATPTLVAALQDRASNEDLRRAGPRALGDGLPSLRW